MLVPQRLTMHVLIVEVCIVTDLRNHCRNCFHVNLCHLRPLSGSNFQTFFPVRSELRVPNMCKSSCSVPCAQDTCMLSWNLLEFSQARCLHDSVHGRHVILCAVSGVIRRMGVSQHRFLLALDLLSWHGHPVLAIAQKHLSVWKQWQVTLAAATKHSMQMNIHPKEVESIPQFLATAHAEDLWCALVGDPYATRSDLSHVSANYLSCVSPASGQRVLCIVADSS